MRGEWPEEARTRAFAGAALAVLGVGATNSHAITGFAAPASTPVYEQESGAGPGVRLEMGVTRPLGRRTRTNISRR